jgi:hypothetical protein
MLSLLRLFRTVFPAAEGLGTEIALVVQDERKPVHRQTIADGTSWPAT